MKIWDRRNRNIDQFTKKIQEKKYEFLKEESKAVENNPKFHVLKQIFNQSPMFYILDSTIISITKGSKSTKEQILNGSWKWPTYMMVSLGEMF